MATKLSIYNGALNVLGERKLSSLSDNVESRLKLDDIYDNDFVDRVLEMGLWRFAKRSVELQASTTITPSFGFQFAFEFPSDWIRTIGIWQDEFMFTPLNSYNVEGRVWFTELETIYVAYVSNDSQFGSDLSIWPGAFTEMSEHYLGYKVAPRLTGVSFNERELERKWKTKLAESKAIDAMEAPAKFKPLGAWANSRQGFRSGRERGERNRLIG